MLVLRMNNNIINQVTLHGIKTVSFEPNSLCNSTIWFHNNSLGCINPMFIGYYVTPWALYFKITDRPKKIYKFILE